MKKQRIKIVIFMALSIALLTVGVLACFFEYSHYKSYKHYVGYGLHADVIIENQSISIPGQTKLYWARLYNFTFWPVKLATCNFITDAMDPGKGSPYAVQRWNPTTNTWETVAENNDESFCAPAPLSKIRADLNYQNLGVGKYVETEWEATGAREPFQKGDRARFVIFQTLEKDQVWKTAVPSVPFVIEDQVEREGNSYRLKH